MDLRKPSGFYAMRSIAKLPNMECVQPSLPSGTASSGRSSLVPPCGTQVTSRFVASGEKPAGREAHSISRRGNFTSGVGRHVFLRFYSNLFHSLCRLF